MVGNDQRVSFWKGTWCGDGPLCVSFLPFLVRSSWSKRSLGEGCLVQDSKGERRGGGGRVGALALLGPLTIERWRAFCYTCVVRNWSWKRRIGCSGWNFLEKVTLQSLELGSLVLFPMKNIWKSCVQPKVSFFAWEASWGKVLTLNQVKKMGWALASRCYFCQAEEEFIDHLLLHCEKIRALWEMLLTLFGVSWVFLSSVRETLLGWIGFFVGKKHKTVWRAGPLCIFWTVWKTRNITFEDEMLSIQRLETFFLNSLWSETTLFIKGCPSIFVKFIDWVGSR